MVRNSFSFLVILVLVSCNFFAKEEINQTYDPVVIPYDLVNPTSILDLPHDLEEISGLAWYGNNVAAINDEDGYVFIISKEGKILEKIKFDGGDDYEGIAVAHGTIYVSNSKGDIFKIGSSIKTTETNNTILSHRNYVEGLAFDTNKNGLLVACKDDAGVKNDIDGRGIYFFDLTNNSLSESPVAVITIEEISEKLLEKGEGNKISQFAPSGIAIHPKSGNIFIISHKGRNLIVLNTDYEIIEVVLLTKHNFKQAEGICFSPEGTLYISNEGRGGRAKLLEFNPR